MTKFWSRNRKDSAIVNTYIGGSIFILITWILFIVGWLINLGQVVFGALSSTGFTDIMIWRVIGLFVAPLGSLLGLFAW